MTTSDKNGWRGLSIGGFTLLFFLLPSVFSDLFLFMKKAEIKFQSLYESFSLEQDDKDEKVFLGG